MRERHKTKVPGIYYRLVDETNPDGPRRYVVWYEDALGVGRTVTLSKGSTLTDAKLRQAALRNRRSQGETLIPTKLTVEELLDQWLGLRRASLKPNTIEVYEWAINNHLKPRLGRRKIRDLSASDLARARSEMVAAGLKKHSIAKIEIPLKNALTIAARDGLISSNPFLKLLPHERVKSDQKEMRCLGKDEIPKLLKAASSEQWKTLFATLVFTGLRISEALSLTWQDLDFKSGLLHVREGKTAAAKRSVMLIPATGRLLTALKLQQAQGVQFVFASGTGLPVNYLQARYQLKKATKKASLPRYTLHELRHTFASILIAQGELPTFVASQMGHSDPAITMRVYVHLWEKEESITRASERLQEAFGGMV